MQPGQRFHQIREFDRSGVHAENLRTKFYEDLKLLRSTMEALQRGDEPEEFPAFEDLVRMVNSYCRKPNPGELARDIPSELLALIVSYQKVGLEAGRDYVFLDMFLTVLLDQFNAYQATLTQELQIKLRTA